MSKEIHERGYWVFGDPKSIKEEHIFDASLAQAMLEYLQGCSVLDLGCGTGEYVKFLREGGCGADGYDGNPHTKAISGGVCSVLDLSQPVQLPPVDWVISLEVGEHIPAQYESVFIRNLVGHAKMGMILSWCIPEKDWPPESGVTEEKGLGHVNCRPNDYVRSQLVGFGLQPDWAMEKALRRAAKSIHFKYTLMAYRKEGLRV